MVERDAKGKLAPAAAVWVGYAVALGVVPSLFPPDPSMPSAAARLGYNVDVAFAAAMTWTALAVALGWFAARKAEATPVSLAETTSRPWRWRDAAIVFALTIVAFWPPFLARYGPLGEDNYFFSVLARMQCAQRPYEDFEFIYGPLLLAPAHAWMQAFGFSMQSYYWLYALLQGLFFGVVMLALQRAEPDPRRRWIVFFILAAMTFDGLMGMNWFGWRRYLSVVAVMLIAARPHDRRIALLAGVIVGAHLALSFEYAAAGLAACGAIYALMLARQPRVGTIVNGLIVLATALASATAFVAAASGDMSAYLESTQIVLSEASALGLGAFKFYWTLHSLAAFGALSLAVVALGFGLRQLGRVAPNEGDRLLVAGIAFAAVALKIALQRADIWHMSAPFFPLGFALLSGHRPALFTLGRTETRIGAGLIAAAAAMTFIGVAPISRGHLDGWLHGAYDIARGRPAQGDIPARGQSVQAERTHADPNIFALAAFLAEPAQANRPVMLYGRMWWLNSHLGVCPIGYLNYEWMYGDKTHPTLRTLAANPNALVIMTADMYADLSSNAPAEVKPADLDILRRIGLITSTVHYRQSPIERAIKSDLWRARIGAELVRTRTVVARFGDFVVLGGGASEATQVQP